MKQIHFQELFSRDEFSGRPTSAFHRENLFFGDGPEGIIQTEGSHWSAQRRFSLKTLKDFGFGKQSLETTVNHEIDLITDTFLAHEDEDYLLSQDFSVPIINILWQLIAGYRFTKENDHGLRVVENVNEAMATGFKSAIYPFWLQKVNYSSYLAHLSGSVCCQCKCNQRSSAPAPFRDSFFSHLSLTELT